MNEENHFRHFLKFFVAFLIIIGLVLGVYFLWGSYQEKKQLSPEVEVTN